MGVEFGCDVVAQPFGIHADVEIAQRRYARAARFRHFLATDRNEAMNKHIVWHFHACKMQHRRPEQRVEVGNVLADEVILLGRRICHEGIEVATGLGEIIF